MNVIQSFFFLSPFSFISLFFLLSSIGRKRRGEKKDVTVTLFFHLRFLSLYLSCSVFFFLFFSSSFCLRNKEKRKIGETEKKEKEIEWEKIERGSRSGLIARGRNGSQSRKNEENTFWMRGRTKTKDGEKMKEEKRMAKGMERKMEEERRREREWVMMRSR